MEILMTKFFSLLIEAGVPKQYVGDIGVAIAFLGIGFFLVILVKRHNLGALMAALYGAYAIESKMFFDFAQRPVIRIVLLILLSVVLFMLFKKFFDEVTGGGPIIIEHTKAILVSCGIVGLFTSIIMSWYAKDELGAFFSSFAIEVFRSNEAQLIWMMVPLVIVYIFNFKR